MAILKKTNGDLPVYRSWLSDFFDSEKFFNEDMFSRRAWPAVNIIDHDKNYEIEVAAPGFKKDDFKLSIDNSILTISAETEMETKKDEKNYTRREFSYTSFNRSFTLPENTDDNGIQAKYENGVLKLTIGKTVATTPKKKEIKVG